MPAVTPKKQNAYFRSFKKIDSSYRLKDSFTNNSINPRSTMYDKFYSFSATRTSNRISKKHTRVSEVERCTNLVQREQYRLLIERYCKTTLAETEKIFCKGDTSDTNNVSRKENEKPPIVVIDDKPISKVFHTKNQSQDSISTTDHNLSSKDSPVQDITSQQSTLLEKNNRISETKSVRFSSFSSHSFPSVNQTLSTPKSAITRQKVSDWFSPPSPYMSFNFIKDLTGSYGRRERERKKKLHEEETRAKMLKEERKRREEILSNLLEERLRVKPVAEVVIPELTEEQETAVEDALIPHPKQEVLREKFSISITRQHIATLDGLNWLNDEIINFYMELIVERSKTRKDLPEAHAMNTFFYPKLSTQGYKSVRRWTKRVDIFSKNIVFYPIHLGIHWTLAVVDFRVKTITYLDSMGGYNQKCLQTLKDYLVSESEDKKKTTLDVSDWKLINMNQNEIPQQLNGSDCGVFACTFAEFISRDAAFDFQQKDMPLIRRTMVWEIINEALTR